MLEMRWLPKSSSFCPFSLPAISIVGLVVVIILESRFFRIDSYRDSGSDNDNVGTAACDH